MSAGGDTVTKEMVSQSEDSGARSRLAAQNTLQVDTDTDTENANFSSFIDEQIIELEEKVDNNQASFRLPVIRQRDPNPTLPDTVTVLDTDWGSKVYLVGTSHISVKSEQDVAKTIQCVQPDIVMVELCKSRTLNLQMNKENILWGVQNMSLAKLLRNITQDGIAGGIADYLYFRQSAKVVKEYGVAPGLEFRRALKEAKKIKGCRLQLGDRPIDVTIQRQLASLSLWNKIVIACGLGINLTPENIDVSEFKHEEFKTHQAIRKAFLDERDFFMAHCLKHASRPLPHPNAPNGLLPTVVVGVVGIAHVQGIKRNWTKEEFTMAEVMTIPKKSAHGTVVTAGVMLSIFGLLSFGGYKIYKSAQSAKKLPKSGT